MLGLDPSTALALGLIRRARDLALSLVDMVQQFGLRAALNDDDFSTGQTTPPEELVNDLERMGPTFVKLGQILATRVDLLPSEWIAQLEKLQDQATAIPFAQLKPQLERSLGAIGLVGFRLSLRNSLRAIRKRGFNLRHVLVVVAAVICWTWPGAHRGLGPAAKLVLFGPAGLPLPG